MLTRLRHRAHGQEGFTLIELLVVILIIGILAAVAIPAFLSQKGKGQDANVKSDINSAQTAEESYSTNANSPGYVADHWCPKGHVLFVIAGALAIEHRDGARYELSEGTTWHVADDAGAPHRVLCEQGATVFIVD